MRERWNTIEKTRVVFFAAFVVVTLLLIYSFVSKPRYSHVAVDLGNDGEAALKLEIDGRGDSMVYATAWLEGELDPGFVEASHEAILRGVSIRLVGDVHWSSPEVPPLGTNCVTIGCREGASQVRFPLLSFFCTKIPTIVDINARCDWRSFGGVRPIGIVALSGDFNDPRHLAIVRARPLLVAIMVVTAAGVALFRTRRRRML